MTPQWRERDCRMPAPQPRAAPIAQVLAPFGHHRAAYDYAFFKLNLPEHDVGLLVDFIIRRRQGLAQVRVSSHAPVGGGVAFAQVPLDRLVIGAMAAPEQGVA